MTKEDAESVTPRSKPDFETRVDSEVRSLVRAKLLRLVALFGTANILAVVGISLTLYQIVKSEAQSSAADEARKEVSRILSVDSDALSTDYDNEKAELVRIKGTRFELDSLAQNLLSHFEDIDGSDSHQAAQFVRLFAKLKDREQLDLIANLGSLNRKIYTGRIEPTKWDSRTVRGKTDNWEPLWKGTVTVPADAVGRGNKALLILSLGGHGLGQHCFFGVFVDEEPALGSSRGSSLVHPDGLVENFWMNAAFVNFAVVSPGPKVLSVVVSNSKERSNDGKVQYTCALNGARISYAILPATEVVENIPVFVDQIH